MQVIVTGGAGFIGAHTCRALLAKGHRVTAVDDLSHGKREAVPDGVELVVLDVRDPKLMTEMEKPRFESAGKIKLTSQDQKFLKALKIAIDEETR